MYVGAVVGEEGRGRESLEKSETNVTWRKQSFVFIIQNAVQTLVCGTWKSVSTKYLWLSQNYYLCIFIPCLCFNVIVIDHAVTFSLFLSRNNKSLMWYFRISGDFAVYVARVINCLRRKNTTDYKSI